MRLVLNGFQYRLKGIALGFIVAFVALSAGCTQGDVQDTLVKPEDFITVEVDQVGKAQVLDTHVLYGPVKGESETSLLGLASGEVKAVYVKNGDVVKVGTPILALKTTAIDRQIAQAEKSLELAASNLSSAEDRYQDALKTLKKNQDLLATGAITQSQLDQIEAQATPAQRDAAKIQKEQAALQLKQLRDSLSDYTFTAKQAGTISQFNVKVGDVIQAGAPIGRITSDKALVVDLLVAESLYVRLNPNVPVSIALEGPKAPLLIEGSISEIGKSPAQNSKLFPVKVTFEGTGEGALNGRVAEVRFELGNNEAQLALPSQVILVDQEGEFVYRLEGVVGDDLSSATAVRTAVTKGFDNGEWTVVAEGLSEGDWIVVKGQQYISPERTLKFSREED